MCHLHVTIEAGISHKLYVKQKIIKRSMASWSVKCEVDLADVSMNGLINIRWCVKYEIHVTYRPSENQLKPRAEHKKLTDWLVGGETCRQADIPSSLTRESGQK